MQLSSTRREGLEEGLQQGREEGIKETKINNARGMKAAGIAPAIIASITGLTLDEINNL